MTKIIGSPPNNGNRLNPEIVAPLKHLINFWRSLNLHLINCEIELWFVMVKILCNNLKYQEYLEPFQILIQLGIKWHLKQLEKQINNAKIYVPVLTSSINDNIKFLEDIKQGFKRTFFCNKYRSEITTQPDNNNLDYLIDPTFRNIYRLFVFSFKNINPRDFFVKYYMPSMEIK